jgi:hypothetical protein
MAQICTSNTLDEAAAWITADTGHAIAPTNLIDAGTSGRLRLMVAIPPACLNVPDGDGYGIDPWTQTGVLEFSGLDCLILKAQRSVKVRSAKTKTGKIVQFNKEVTVTAEMLLVRREDLLAFASTLEASNSYSAPNAGSEIKTNDQTVQQESDPCPKCAPFRDMDKLNPSEISIAFVAGDSGGAILEISARKAVRRVSLGEFGLWDGRTGAMNSQAGVLLGMARGLLLQNATPDQQKYVSRIRKEFRKHLGIQTDPFQRYVKAIGYAPLFKIVDTRNAADERAKRDAERNPLSLDDLGDIGGQIADTNGFDKDEDYTYENMGNEASKEEDYEADCETDKWLKEHDH